MIDDDIALIISMSFEGCEGSDNLTTAQALQAVIQSDIAQGQIVVAFCGCPRTKLEK